MTGFSNSTGYSEIGKHHAAQSVYWSVEYVIAVISYTTTVPLPSTSIGPFHCTTDNYYDDNECVGPRTEGNKRMLAALDCIRLIQKSIEQTDRQTDTRLVLYAYCYGHS